MLAAVILQSRVAPAIMATIRKPSQNKQNGMFAPEHVVHTNYEHMCYQQRVGMEERLFSRAMEARR